jgi:hypothetical protein
MRPKGTDLMSGAGATRCSRAWTCLTALKVSYNCYAYLALHSLQKGQEHAAPNTYLQMSSIVYRLGEAMIHTIDTGVPAHKKYNTFRSATGSKQTTA